ncbi:MSS4 Phosphatidylinositol-4-phosphate 5-kinase [Pyrenophora tritici-repentis]|uniref:MSS4, Phosphatidylinositol-4-phosphate 5-kinase n=1 Tax=Pyrenophora tritici-repentis TaxID=45151 RepID=A0A2W1FBV7_9PLEO|nr:phosphatidylinositol-4-phosphate 5-kinase core [Pyrenophora tritici-repentis]KAF7449179.1 phosphatidylinositol-4-phosphate 5-kinase core [Pyrenophora tritici-repentis]KAF7570818.1 MSS4, Phosphatidylinositol-4-phosphate 5-kinase [Pyrenophora tritici-repentis]KAG9383880.1 phosphatidylinositol-4-phosphate 5-kinase core [Pyrenophora tritici-repentis]KAI0589098.1 phosphatidylinositol-4-phosphate 5-kinase core [Pyrenophora tritici-repentis]
MGRRDRLISTSILGAIFKSDSPRKDESERPGLFARIWAFFALFSLTLARYRASLFKKLRNETWEIEEEEYTESFRSPSKSKRTDLVAIGDLGYSGSTFFTTPNSKFLIKSLPRKFEQSFFRDRLLAPYVEHMELNEDSLLVRITDLLYCPTATIGAALGTAPSHHIIMENILYGKSSCGKDQQKRWETYDLKPNDYFYPERDVANGKLAPESVKKRLIDEFEDKIRVTIDQKEELIAQLSRDSKILQANNAVDYSLFLVRYPADLGSSENDKVPPPPGRGSPWRSGIVSRDGKWVYRAIILDFFWAKDALQAKTLTSLVKLFNAVKPGRDHGPMSITTTSDEYRQRFLGMVEDMVEVPDSAGRPAGEIRSPATRAIEQV